MMMIPSSYIINNLVVFDVKNRTLTSLEDSENTVILYAPASRCLFLLLQNRSTILDKNIFFDEVWKKNGVHVTANTFYQNISILRRGFIKLGLGNEVINTIPRKGLQLSRFLIITEKTESSEPEEKKDSTQHKNEKTQKKQRRINYNLKSIFIISILLFIITACQLIKTSLIADTDFFSEYSYVKEIGQCIVYTDDNNNMIGDNEKFIKMNINACKTYKHNYLTKYKFSQRASVIRCDKPMGSKRINCLSEYHIL